MDFQLFFEVHKDLPREGPGSPDEVRWATGLANVPPDGAICDAGCGPGGDFAALLEAIPEGRLVGVDTTEHFITEALAKFDDDKRVEAKVLSMEDADSLDAAPFDMIWCAGALYFFGVPDGLAALKKAMKPGGVVAFSYPCFFTDPPSAKAKAFWGDDISLVQSEAGLLSAVAESGFEVLGHRKVSDEAWEAYYQPQDARVAALRPDASPELVEVLDMCDAEAAGWRAAKDDTGYMLVVARLK